MDFGVEYLVDSLSLRNYESVSYVVDDDGRVRFRFMGNRRVKTLRRILDGTRFFLRIRTSN